MPCKPQTARKLLKEKKAVVVRLMPFTIQLTIATGETVQSGVVGIDSGYNHMAASVIIGNKEVFSSEILLRKDMVDLNSDRRQYRRNRRYRKTWYRKPRFLNRKKDKGWLAPSIQHKKETHIKIIELIKKLAPIKKVIFETASFDIQKINNPEIERKKYQEGVQKDFWNVREYVLHRDQHRCQQCKGKSKEKVLQVHHINSRKTGGDRPDNLVTLCSACHANLHANNLKLKTKKLNGFRAETFMSMIRWKLLEDLKVLGNNVVPTYGYITKSKRIELELEKSHCNDAFVIAGGTTEERSAKAYLIKQVRKQNRKLFKGIRSHIRNTAPRFIQTFQRFDKVKFKGKQCFIFGRRSSGYFDLRKLDGLVIHRSAKAKKLKLVQSFNTLLWEPIGNKASLPPPIKIRGLILAGSRCSACKIYFRERSL